MTEETEHETGDQAGNKPFERDDEQDRTRYDDPAFQRITQENRVPEIVHGHEGTNFVVAERGCGET
jgi:hypothetical protein